MCRRPCEPTVAKNWFHCLRLVMAAVLALRASSLPAQGSPNEVAAESFDAAPFGMVDEQPDATAFGVRWGTTRKVRSVAVEFAAGGDMPPTDKIRVQYWHKNWDGRADPIVRYAAAGSGWTPMDDWTNGQWKDADAKISIEGRRVAFVFAPSGAKEFPDLGSPGVPYRKTLKVRVVADRPLPKIAGFQALTISELRPLTVRILWGRPACVQIKTPEADPCRLEVFNGQVPRDLRDGGEQRDGRQRRNLDAAARCTGRHRGRPRDGRPARRRFQRCHRRDRPLQIPPVLVLGR